MTHSVLEHVNLTVSDARKTANQLCKLFDWKIRWHGPSLGGGTTYHVGGGNSYIAIYSKGRPARSSGSSYKTINGLNHLGIVVDNLRKIEKRVIAMGFVPTNHSDYEPGCRFYFEDHDNVEYEVISYSTKKMKQKSSFAYYMGEIAKSGIMRR